MPQHIGSGEEKKRERLVYLKRQLKQQRLDRVCRGHGEAKKAKGKQ